MRHLWRVAPPLLAFLCVQAVLLAAVRPRNQRWESASWNRGDAMHYVSIAERGYFIHTCDYGGRPAWCGNAGWLPGYPLVVRGAMGLGLASMPAALLVTLVARLAFLWLVWWRMERLRPRWLGLLTLAVVAFWPGVVYQHAAFPLSLFAALTTGALEAGERRHWVLAGLLGLGAAYTYPPGFLMGGVLGLGALLARERPLTVALAGGLPPLGFLAALYTQWRDLAVWQAFFEVHRHYGNTGGLQNPFRTLEVNVAPLFEQWPRRDWCALQTVVVLAVMGLTLALAWRARASPRARLEGLFGLAYWLFPLLVGRGMSLYRTESLLCSGAPLLRRARPWILLLLLALFAWIDYKVAIRFFRFEIV